MLSTQLVNIDIHKNMIGVIAEALPVAPLAGDSIKVFIP